jgi:hypothetical protein
MTATTSPSAKLDVPRSLGAGLDYGYLLARLAPFEVFAPNRC